MGQHPRSVLVSGSGCLLCVTSRVLSKGWWLEKLYHVIDLQPKQVGPQDRQGSARMKEEKGVCRQLSGQKGKREGTNHLVLHIIRHGYFGHSRRLQRGVGSSIGLWFRMPRQQVPASKAAGIFGVRGFLADCCGRGSAEYRPHDA